MRRKREIKGGASMATNLYFLLRLKSVYLPKRLLLEPIWSIAKATLLGGTVQLGLHNYTQKPSIVYKDQKEIEERKWEKMKNGFSTVFYSLRFLSDRCRLSDGPPTEIFVPLFSFSLFHLFQFISLFYLIFNFHFSIFSHLFLDYIFSFPSKKRKHNFCLCLCFGVGEDALIHSFRVLMRWIYNEMTVEAFNFILIREKRECFRYYD